METVRSVARQRKKEAILDGAVAEFLQGGYSGTSIDQIVAKTGISKPTVYAHFDGKEALFAAILRRIVERTLVPTHEIPIEHGKVRKALLSFAKDYAEVAFSDEMLALHRLIAGECQRLPDCGAVYFGSGYIVAREGLARVLAGYDQLGDLSIHDPNEAAVHFWGLVLGPAHNYQLFHPARPMSRSEVVRSLTAGLDVFLRAYAPTPGARRARTTTARKTSPSRRQKSQR